MTSHQIPGQDSLVVAPDTVVSISFVVVNDETGEEVDRVEPDDAVSFPVGRGKVLAALEEGLLGARAGETRTVAVEVDHPVFEHRLSFVVTVHAVTPFVEGSSEAECSGEGCGRCCGGACDGDGAGEVHES